MLPLALFLAEQGHDISGSDRSHDQGNTLEKFDRLKEKSIILFPQDGSGIHEDTDVLVVSSAVEDSIPDVKKALSRNIQIIKRGELLAQCFNVAETGVAVAGTSGKSTVTGMIATMLTRQELDPTFVNGGAVRLNDSDDAISVHCGDPDMFVAEIDESDGSINHYNPFVAVLNNIALDHKSMDELEQMFGDYIARASKAVVINADDKRVSRLAIAMAEAPIISFGIGSKGADLSARDIKLSPHGSTFTVKYQDAEFPAILHVPGQHNISNALAAIGAGLALDLDPAANIKSLGSFHGIHRRMELIGTRGDITVIDDFAHNPDKIAASLSSLKTFDGRLIVMFQPHGFGPLKLMGQEIMDVFAQYLDAQDHLLIPEAYYAGGTVDRSVTAKGLIDGVSKKLPNARWFEERKPIAGFIKEIARAGDRIVIMGARDDTLHDFAKSLLKNF